MLPALRPLIVHGAYEAGVAPKGVLTAARICKKQRLYLHAATFAILATELDLCNLSDGYDLVRDTADMEFAPSPGPNSATRHPACWLDPYRAELALTEAGVCWRMTQSLRSRYQHPQQVVVSDCLGSNWAPTHQLHPAQYPPQADRPSSQAIDVGGDPHPPAGKPKMPGPDQPHADSRPATARVRGEHPAALVIAAGPAGSTRLAPRLADSTLLGA